MIWLSSLLLSIIVAQAGLPTPNASVAIGKDLGWLTFIDEKGVSDRLMDRPGQVALIIMYARCNHSCPVMAAQLK
jgi:cytochrome oxidase Cu insertion factor (SCO1/SenC/PrrC family)